MTPGHDQTVPATPDRTRARSAVSRRSADARVARPAVRTLEVSWAVGRRAIAASRPDLGISADRGPVCVGLRMRLAVSDETAEVIALDLIDGDRQRSVDLAALTGTAIAHGSSGLLHVQLDGLIATFETRTGRPVYVCTSILGELLGLEGGRYELDRAS